MQRKWVCVWERGRKGDCLSVLELKNLGCVIDESGTNRAECSRKVASAISSLVNAMDL